MSSNEWSSMTRDEQRIATMREEHGFIPFEPSNNPALHFLATDPALRRDVFPEDWTGFTKTAEREFRARVKKLGAEISGINGIPIPPDMPLLWIKARRANQLYTYDRNKDLVYLLSHHLPPSWIRIRRGLLADFVRIAGARTVIPQPTPTSDNTLVAGRGQYISHQPREYIQRTSNIPEMPQSIPLVKQDNGVGQGSTMLSHHSQGPSQPTSDWLEVAQTRLASKPSVGTAQRCGYPPDPNYFSALPDQEVPAHQPQTVPGTSNIRKRSQNEVWDLPFWDLPFPKAAKLCDDYPEITAATKAAHDQGARLENDGGQRRQGSEACGVDHSAEKAAMVNSNPNLAAMDSLETQRRMVVSNTSDFEALHQAPYDARHDTRHATAYDTSINQAVSSTASRTNNGPEARGQVREGIDAAVARVDTAKAATTDDSFLPI
ncbi:hypothetical protein Ptr902_07907 [Pyrenophora tritici-repentis]|nr:hypothetical protein Ptr902_07907 [Pyrenophora tritici-repentis]